MKQAKKSEAIERSSAINLRIPTKKEIVENPKRAWFIGGGWVDSADLYTINVYWHRRRKLFTTYSLLQVLEHETLHSVLARAVNLEASVKLDKVHRSICVWHGENKLVFVNEIFIKEWVFPDYVEEPSDEMLD